MDARGYCTVQGRLNGFVLDAFPLTGSGKIQKFKLRQMWQAGRWP